MPLPKVNETVRRLNPHLFGASPVAPPVPAKAKAQRAAPSVGAMEAIFFKAYDIPQPTPEYHFDSKRKWRFDWAWPDYKVALEVEGGVWTGGRHTRGEGFLRDLEKYNEAACQGWLLLRTTPDKLRTLETADNVSRAIRLRSVPAHAVGQENIVVL